ncbi:hypothetical protein Cgig2_033149 [Carnegiea gigantea]|uniref:Uncharacterized protein n=1 Tax=Carnegiea gigantea TaxID=171969 RepID=A0A9Q1GS32_9CARY|nr:hypothetical protein Cgig2_033149 [Carnegiea gigantea]
MAVKVVPEENPASEHQKPAFLETSSCYHHLRDGFEEISPDSLLLPQTKVLSQPSIPKKGESSCSLFDPQARILPGTSCKSTRPPNWVAAAPFSSFMTILSSPLAARDSCAPTQKLISLTTWMPPGASHSSPSTSSPASFSASSLAIASLKASISASDFPSVPDSEETLRTHPGQEMLVQRPASRVYGDQNHNSH